jgi:hypothetical protein
VLAAAAVKNVSSEKERQLAHAQAGVGEAMKNVMTVSMVGANIGF